GRRPVPAGGRLRLQRRAVRAAFDFREDLAPGLRADHGPGPAGRDPAEIPLRRQTGRGDGDAAGDGLQLHQPPGPLRDRLPRLQEALRAPGNPLRGDQPGLPAYHRHTAEGYPVTVALLVVAAVDPG